MSVCGSCCVLSRISRVHQVLQLRPVCSSLASYMTKLQFSIRTCCISFPTYKNSCTASRITEKNEYISTRSYQTVTKTLFNGVDAISKSNSQCVHEISHQTYAKTVFHNVHHYKTAIHRSIHSSSPHTFSKGFPSDEEQGVVSNSHDSTNLANKSRKLSRLKVNLGVKIKKSESPSTAEGFSYIESTGLQSESKNEGNSCHSGATNTKFTSNSSEGLPCSPVSNETGSVYNKLEYGLKPTLPQRLVSKAPPTLQAYLKLMRLDRPIGSWLLFWPCGWSLALAAPSTCLPDPHLLIVFALGSVVMRGAGCTINDLWDKDLDGKVARTASRPLASGALTSLDALALLGAQLGVGCLLLLQLNWPSVLLGASSLGLVVVYPLMKRVTYWPQLVLGFTFNWGALLGWCAVHGHCHLPACLPLYLAGVCWTLVYDTIYAHQDKEDDATIGIKSTALRMGKNTRQWLGAFTVAMTTGLLASGTSVGLAWPYHLAVMAVLAHLSTQIYMLDIHNPADCGQKFRANRHVGLLLFTGIIAGNLLRDSTEDEEKVGDCASGGSTQVVTAGR